MLLLLLSTASLLAGVYAEENLAVGTPLLVSSFATRPQSCSNGYPVVNLGAGNTTDECVCVVTNGSTPANTKDWYATALTAPSFVSSVRISGINTSIDVLVGYEFAANMSLNEFSLCTRYNAADNAQKVNCTGPVRGSVVALRALDDTSQIHICGVDVFGTSKNMLLASQNISWQMLSLTPAPQGLPSLLVDGNVTSCVEYNFNELVIYERGAKFAIPAGVSRPFRAVIYHANVPLDALKIASCGDSGLVVSIITQSSLIEIRGTRCRFVTASVASSVAEYECTCPQDYRGELVIRPFSNSFAQQWRLCEVILFPQCLAGTAAPAGAATCTQCPAGTAAPAGAANCTQCVAGTAAPAGAGSCTQCPAGTAAPAGAANCTVCSAGTAAPAGAPTCTTCSAGTYQNATGQSSCVACPAGKYQNATGQSSCVPCPVGQYQNATGQASCVNCTAGQTSAAGDTTCHVAFQKCVRQATITNTGSCSIARMHSACPLHYDNDKTTYVGSFLDFSQSCGSAIASQTGFTYDSASNRCVRQATIINTSSCSGRRVISGCPPHYDSDKTTVVGDSFDWNSGCDVNSSCACATGFIYDSVSKRCVRNATIINANSCTSNRILSGCPLHYDNDKTSYVGVYLDNNNGCGSTCACQTGYTYDSASNKCVRQTTVTNTSSCSNNRIASGCPPHYDSDKTTYIGQRLDYFDGCLGASSCICQTGFTYDTASYRCVRQATIINTNNCTTSRMKSGCPLHYDSNKANYVGTYFDHDFCGASSTCACQSGYDLIMV